jgi:predicted nucleic acid-binding protein
MPREGVVRADSLRINRHTVKYLVDSDVLSEPTRPVPDQRVVRWLRRNESELAISAIVLGELRFGILLLPAGRRRRRLEEWFAAGVQQIRLLDFDQPTAMAWSELLARLRKKGQAMPIKDSLIAASAMAHGLTIATRNLRDFRLTGGPVVNPFDP